MKKYILVITLLLLCGCTNINNASVQDITKEVFSNINASKYENENVSVSIFSNSEYFDSEQILFSVSNSDI